MFYIQITSDFVKTRPRGLLDAIEKMFPILHYYTVHKLNPPPSPKVWKISRNFAVKKGQKKGKNVQKVPKKPFFHTFTKVLIWPRPPPLNVDFFFEGFLKYIWDILKWRFYFYYTLALFGVLEHCGLINLYFWIFQLRKQLYNHKCLLVS